MKSELPIACILKGADHRNRIAANMALAGSLISQRRDGRTLTLIYPLTVAADVGGWWSPKTTAARSWTSTSASRPTVCAS